MIRKLCSGGTTHLESYCALHLDNQTDKDKRLKIILRGITNFAAVNDIHFDLTKNETCRVFMLRSFQFGAVCIGRERTITSIFLACVEMMKLI